MPVTRLQMFVETSPALVETAQGAGLAKSRSSCCAVYPPHKKNIPNNDQIFHVLFDLDERFQVPGTVNYPFNKTYEYDGYEPEWKGIYDDKGRVMVAMSFNSDMGDSWEWADDPNYPEKYSALGIRIAVNYVVYSMTH